MTKTCCPGKDSRADTHVGTNIDVDWHGPPVPHSNPNEQLIASSDVPSELTRTKNTYPAEINTSLQKNKTNFCCSQQDRTDYTKDFPNSGPKDMTNLHDSNTRRAAMPEIRTQGKACATTDHTTLLKTCSKGTPESFQSCCMPARMPSRRSSHSNQQCCKTLNEEIKVVKNMAHKNAYSTVCNEKQQKDDSIESSGLEQGTKTANLVFSINGMTCTSCARKVMVVLSRMASVSNANVNFITAKGELWHDPLVISNSDLLAQLAKETGFGFTRLHDKLQTLDLCMGQEVVQRWVKIPPTGVSSIEKYKQIFCVTYDPTRIGARTLFELSGAQALGPLRKDFHVVANRKRLTQMFTSFLIALIFTVPLVVLEWSNNSVPYSTRSVIAIVLASVVQCVAIPEFYIGATKSLIYSGVIEMDMLVVISITSAYLYSVVAFILTHAGYVLEQGEFFETSALLILLVILGRLISAYAKHKAMEAVSLKSLQVDTAYIVTSMGQSKMVDARLLQYDDVLLVPPHSRIVTDGWIIAGISSVDESMLTGESVPVLKEVGNYVTAGTINVEGLLTIRLTRLPGQNSITDIASLVETALSNKLKVQDLVDNIAGYFTPGIVIIAVIVFAVWTAISFKIRGIPAGSSIGIAITYSIAVLAISCPCALGLAVPMVLIIAGDLGARSGVIIKRVHAIERGQRVTDVVFDKTGTLTYSKLQVLENVFLSEQFTKAEIDSLVLSLVKEEKHPVSIAVSSFINTMGVKVDRIDALQSMPGKGIEAKWKGRSVRAGNPYWLEIVDDSQITKQKKAGNTLFCVTIDSSLVAVYRLEAALRTESLSVVHELKTRGISCHIVSGDNPEAVNATAVGLGIPADNMRSRQSPADKQAYVRELMDRGKHVLFVGDGTNDAVAVAQAHIGVQIGNISDVTSANSDVVLLGGLEGIIKLLDISKATFRRIAFNFVWSAVYNVFAILLAAGAFVTVRIPPAYAGLGEMVSVLPVVLVAVTLLLS